MGAIYKSTQLRWFTTPEELRKIADDMEEKYKKARLGSDLTTYVVSTTDTELRILVDQERMKSEG